jgi:hypothetical protein
VHAHYVAARWTGIVLGAVLLQRPEARY